ncbi:MAG TPA: DUF3343 domain-containing protein [Eubacteriales bacterium]|nr:DUF3343 domain-containing protein [Eubacteriales bacterium]
MTNRAYYLFAFDSPHAAIAAQRLLRDVGGAVMPTLRAITASCGMSIRVGTELVARAREIMAGSAIDPALYRLYYVEQEGADTRCTEVLEES